VRDDYVEIGKAGGDRFAGVFPVGDFGDFFWGVVAEESSKKNFFSIGELFADGWHGSIDCNDCFPVHRLARAFNLFCSFLSHFLNPVFMSTNNASASSLAIDALNPLSLQGVIRSPLEINGPRSLSSFAIATGGTFNYNGGSNFAGVLSNPFDDARVYANGAVTLNGVPTFSGFEDGLTLGPTGRLQNVSAQVAGSLKLGKVAQAIAIDVPAYLVPTVGAFDRTIESWRMRLNGAADVAQAFGSGELRTVRFAGGSLNLPTATVLKNLTIVVENGDVNFNGDRHLLENVRLIVLNGSVNLGDVQGQNLEVYAARSIHMNQAARFSGKSFLGTQNGDVIFNGATSTIEAKDYVKVVAHGDVIFNAIVSTPMQTLTKNYILDENQNAIAVQIPIAEFEHLEELLENYGLLQLMDDPVDSDRLSKTDALKYYKALQQNHVDR